MDTKVVEEIENGSLHLAQLIHCQAQRFGNHPAMYYKESQDAPWLPVGWEEFSQRIMLTADALVRYGVEEEERIGIFSQNHPDCFYVDFAAFANRAVTIPLYATGSEAQVRFIVNNAEIRLLFVGSQLQYDTAFRVMSLCPSLERLIIFDNSVQLNEQDKASLYFDDFVFHNENNEACRRTVEERMNRVSFDDLASILYTSGTTGDSKGVMLHHSNFRAAVEAHVGPLKFLSPHGVVLNYLPLAHIFERAWCYVCFSLGATIYVNSNPWHIQQSLKEVRPQAMCCVPRFWEKIYHGVREEMDRSTGVKRRIMNEALRVGRVYNLEYVRKGKSAPVTLKMQYAIYEKTVYSYLRKLIGLDRGLIFPTAGAAISREVEEFIHSVGIPLVAGYGLTETTATVSCFWKDYTVGAVGNPLPCVEVKIGENNEICVRGGTVTRGYYRNEQATRKAIDPEGWFHTGDAGTLKGNVLTLTERIKDLFKTSNGKYIAPQQLETQLVVDRYIEQVVIVANNRKFVSALIVPNFANLKKYALDKGITYESMEELLALPAIIDFFAQRIETLQQSFASYEKIKKFVLLPRAFSVDEGEVTQTLKVRRPVVNEHFASLIEEMYRE